MEPFAFPIYIDPKDTAWYKDASCQTSDPESFFVESGDNYPPELKRICGDCDVKFECLEFAIKYKAHGFWGGTNEKQRKYLAKNRPLQAS